ncbi:MAG: endonuclease/exonuclease/phosphatase family protein, partial [Streptomyces sp.]
MLTGEVEQRGTVRGGGAGDRRAPRARRRPLAWFAGLLLAGVSVPLAARGMDADGPTPVPQLLAFLPWFLAPGWLALLCAVYSRRFLATVWAIAVLVAAGWFTLPQGPDAVAAGERPAEARFRVLTANVR